MTFLQRFFLIGIAAVCLSAFAGCSSPDYSRTNESTVFSKEENEEIIRLRINGDEFQIKLEQNQTAEKLRMILPKKFRMQDLHQNEKYYNLTQSLPTNATRVGKIEAGDVMLYGDDTLVIFYQSFETNFSYTRIGRIVETQNLAERFGVDDIAVERSN
ncbi:hypothetical protein JZO77_23525 [Enterococcus hulanensis]|uniref:cyclophilin-like fold protein n=1 Tax=Enterococcus hulanensis TaxID=2559929 RepID=UPI001A8D616B|nr:cyclophilin-like fold protein [Enterococcus hulanensis]MBO0459710.1 hypothetical protein [Enterococcus hulanensis]